jgi:hypothetical protein
VASAGADPFDNRAAKFADCEWARTLEARWNERNDRGQNIRTPEYARLSGGQLRVDCEAKAPNAG